LTRLHENNGRGFFTIASSVSFPQSPGGHLYRNNRPGFGNKNHWLKVQLNGQASNRSGIGAKIRVKAMIGGQEIWQLRELNGNGMSETCPGLIAHFGLGDATQPDVVRVEWPSGNAQELTDRPVDQVLTITEQVLTTPVRPSASLGGSVTLTAQLNGTWQWYHDGVALDGQTTKTLNLSTESSLDLGYQRRPDFATAQVRKRNRHRVLKAKKTGDFLRKSCM
jgi:hypothetical protein